MYTLLYAPPTIFKADVIQSLIYRGGTLKLSDTPKTTWVVGFELGIQIQFESSVFYFVIYY